MGLMNDLKKKLTPETYAALENELGDDFNDDLVPRARLNKVIAERNALRSKVTTENPENDHEPESTGAATFTKEDVDALVKKAQDEFVSKLAEQNQRLAITEKLRSVVHHPELILPLIDKTKVTFDEFGNPVAGLDEQINTFKTKYAQEFKDYVPAGTGADNKDKDVSSTREELETALAEAQKSGNIVQAVAIKRKIFDTFKEA